jgi:hypothetical protein
MIKNKLTFLQLTTLLVSAAVGAQAQMVNCNGFLKGKYIEAGINWNGAFGSSVRPPAGYHPHNTAGLYNAVACGSTHTTDSSIAFVADPAKDGWSTGTPPYYGDYLLPGNPQEGWSYMVDGVQVNAWNSVAVTQDSIGSGMISYIMSYTNAAGISQVKSQAIKEGIYITHFYTLDTSKLYINVEVEIENTSLSTISNVYYMRTVNPHNDQYYSSVASTKNKIVRALPDSLNRTAIATWGTVNTDAYLALATQDFRAKGFIYKNTGLPTGNTIDNIYSGDANYLYNLNDSNVANTSIGIIYDLGNFISGFKTHFTYIYAFHPSAIDSDEFTDPHVGVSVVRPQDIKLYPNPAANSIFVDGIAAGGELQITDLSGRQVFLGKITSEHTSYQLPELKQGMYIAILRGAYGETLKRTQLCIQ